MHYCAIHRMLRPFSYIETDVPRFLSQTSLPSPVDVQHCQIFLCPCPITPSHHSWRQRGNFSGAPGSYHPHHRYPPIGWPVEPRCEQGRSGSGHNGDEDGKFPLWEWADIFEWICNSQLSFPSDHGVLYFEAFGGTNRSLRLSGRCFS